MADESKGGSVQRVSNRFFLKIAGKRFRAYSIVKHRGRRSGREYQNPVSAYPLEDGFVVPVLYGTGSQWVRNVMASGGFILRTKARDIPLERPEIIPPSQALTVFPPLLRWTMRSRKIKEFLWAHRATGSEAGS
jgi:hypothetical protein